MLQKKNQFTILFAIGAVILVLGLFFSWYPNSVISGMNEIKQQGGLSPTEQNKYDEALGSLNIWQITVFNPASSVLSVIGLIIIVYAVIQKIFALSSNNNIDKTQNIPS